MDIKFESNLDFQLDAIASITDLFKGQLCDDEPFPLFMEGGVYPNHFSITDEQILANLQQIQRNNNLPMSEILDGRRFSVEMETGTGKTYVYLRTIFELNARYGLRKFIVIVPSIAIKEGVLKTLDITTRHFKKIYENLPYNFYEYDSSKINAIRHFARSNCVEIMVMTLDSFNKDTNIMNQAIDKLGGQRPIDFVSKTHPVVILDEPQNMESENARKAIQGLDPLFELRYSATHRQYYNLVYRLTPINAYNKKLVKRIEVFSVTKDGDYNGAFVKCEDISAEKSGLRAKVQAYKKQGTGHKLATITIKKGDDLSDKTGYGEYVGFRAVALNASAPKYIEFSNGVKLAAGQASGDDKKSVMRAQIRHTIEEHFQKQERLKHQGVKVLSLFFIDRVASYLDKDGFIRTTFIEEYESLKGSYPTFKSTDVNEVHEGYFSTYKTERSMEEDKEAFDIIMRNKERLLSMEEPVQFIFSHSALREGWDNPNIFNICTLNETVSEMKKRQEIGRGLRLPVTQTGERFRDPDLNVLTVFSNESYTDYVTKLQKEYVDEYGGTGVPPMPGNANKSRTVHLKKGFLLSPEFQELWARISKKTKYSVRFDSNKLIDECVQQAENICLEPVKLRLEKVKLNYIENSIETIYIGERDVDYVTDYPLPNLVENISRETMLTRRSVVEILSRMHNLEQCYNNPKGFIERLSSIIKERMNAFLIDGIRYVELPDFWRMELFKDALESYETVTVPVTKSVYDSVEVDSEGERSFAIELENDSKVKLFIKLPPWFTVPTPIGAYNPDWAIVMCIRDIDGQVKETLYLARETKFVTSLDNLRPSEEGKIKCAKAHFGTIGVDFREVKCYQELI